LAFLFRLAGGGWFLYRCAGGAGCRLEATAGSPPRRAGNFLLLAQKKVTKEEGLNTIWPDFSGQRAHHWLPGVRLGKLASSVACTLRVPAFSAACPRHFASLVMQGTRECARQRAA